tara:strand:+ start:502 stop:987 length:486 start_codon:yes stop_codon:yes gene_type:complete
MSKTKQSSEEEGILTEKTTNRLIMILVIGIGLGSPIATIVGHWYAKKRTIEMLAEQLLKVPEAYAVYVKKNNKKPNKIDKLLPFFNTEKVAGINLHTIIRGSEISFIIDEGQKNPLRMILRDTEKNLVCTSEYNESRNWSKPSPDCEYLQLVQDEATKTSL